PIFNARLPINGGASTVTCAASGCHDDANGTGGAFRVVPGAAAVDLTDLANTPDVVKALDIYKNFYSAQAMVVFGSPTQSRLPIVAAWLLLATLLSPPARAADAPLERLQVTDPYLELHTGPGRGYPVFFVVAREEWVAVELRYTDWFKVRTDAGKEGWVHRRQ